MNYFNSTFVIGKSVLATLITLGCSFLAGCDKKPPAANPVQNVYVVSVNAKDNAEVKRTLSAVVSSDTESTLAFKTAGRVSQKLIDVGQMATKGQVLYRLEPEDYSSSYLAAESQWKAAVFDAKQQRIEADRLGRLVKDGSVARADWEKQVARANAANAGSNALQQQLNLSKNRVEDTIIKAPYAGVITKTLAEVGQVVSSGQPILTIAKTTSLEAVVNVPEQMAQDLSTWQASFSDWKGQTHIPLKLKEVAAIANPISRTYEARYVGVPSSYKLGMTGKVNFYHQNQTSNQVVSVPSTSIVKRNGSPIVWVLQSNQTQVKAVPISVSSYSDNSAQVSGLNNGQTIVSIGAYKVDPQRPVHAIQTQSL